jgi:iron complex outermembrane receptor protein
VSLRGLSVNSTLVMIDGLRNANYPLADDGQKAFVDLNSIPFNAVERIETLKDGASSLYGADAIGGVVNIIMKSNYQGMSADASYGTSQHGGGDQYRFNGDIGYGDLDTDKYNVYFDVEYQLDKTHPRRPARLPVQHQRPDLDPGRHERQPAAGGSTFYGNVKRATLGTPGDLATGRPVGGAPTCGSRCAPARTDAPLTVDTAFDDDGVRWAATAPRTSPTSATSSPSRSAPASTAASRSSRATTSRPIWPQLRAEQDLGRTARPSPSRPARRNNLRTWSCRSTS